MHRAGIPSRVPASRISPGAVALFCAVAGIAVGVVALHPAFPWYSVEVRVYSGPYFTGDWEPLFSFDGWNGFSASYLVKNSAAGKAGLRNFVQFPVPFGLLYLAAYGYFLFQFLFARTKGKRAARMVLYGIFFLLPVIVLIILFALLPRFIGPMPEGAGDVLDEAAAHPFGGEAVAANTAYGTAYLRWGPGPGMKLLVLSAMLFFLGAGAEAAGRRFHGTDGSMSPLHP